MSIVILVFFVLLVVLNILKIVLERREVKKMTLKEFERKVKFYCDKKDGKGLVSFMGRNSLFVLTHQKQVADILRAYGGTGDNNSSEV